MARAKVCRFYDDAKGGALLRSGKRSPKRLPDYENVTGAAASMYKRRYTHGKQMPRGLVVQALAIVVIFVLLVVPSLEPPTDTRGQIGSLFSGARSWGTSSTAAPALNIPQNKVRPGVSLVAVCMGRPDTLRQTAKSWLQVKRVDEIILVDWSSEHPLEPVVRSIEGGQRIKVIRVEGEKSWVLSRAYNLAVNASSFAHVIRTDCDYRVGENFVAGHQLLFDAKAKGGAANGAYYSGNYLAARNENEVHLNGAVFIRRADFVKIGGYDERIQTYGWDDEDLYKRLEDSGLTKHNISYDHVSHVKHGDSARAQTGVKFAAVEIDVNSLLLDKLPKWSSQMQPSSYASPQSATPNSLRVRAESRPKSLRELSTEEAYEEAWATALGRRLHDSYEVPWDIISKLPNSTKEMLLRRLMARMENRERTERQRLDAAGLHDHAIDESKIALPRLFLCHCMHGLGNRLRALASCMSFAKSTNRELIVIWETDSHIEARFADLFASPMVVLEKFTPEWPFVDIQRWDAAWKNFKFFNYMEMEKKGAVKGAPITDIPNMHMYYKGAYIIENPSRELTNWVKDNANLRELKPVAQVAEKLRALEALGLGGDNVVGLHIRNRTLAMDIKNVDFVSEYGDEATKTMEGWRKSSSVNSFVSEIRKQIKEKPNVKFFVATDTFTVIEQLEKMFGKERILSVKRSCDERDGQCVRYALADMYALSKCKSLYGSNWSSFTEGAERLGGIRAKLAGKDFGPGPNTLSS